MTSQSADTMLRRLQELGIATPEQIKRAKQEQAKTHERFGVVLARLGLIRAADSGKPLASRLGWVVTPLDPSPISLNRPVSAELCRAHRVVPIREEAAGHLLVATDDPFTALALEWLEGQFGMPLGMVVVREQDLNLLLDRVGEVRAMAPSAVPARQPSAAKPVSRAKPSGPPSKAVEPVPDAADEPIIRLVDSLLSEAVRMRASDIHLEPLSDRLNVRYRIDGVLRDVNSPPKALQGPVTSRIKIMAGLNIAEKRLPQDGRLQLRVGDSTLDVRLSTLPALHGESIVMRLLDRSQPIRGLDELGFAKSDQQRWGQLIQRPYGMILVTGPTGSGKTTTLYATLATLNRPDRKLITLEDPVEYQLTGVNQVHIKPAIGLTFASGLRAILRQAPDVIMVGEIRDQETAQIAIQAALTGHLVFSTLHTNDAPSAVTRLIDMGVAPFLVASTIQGVMAQRLVRRICPACQMRRAASAEERAFVAEAERGAASDAAALPLSEGRGCNQCHGSGYRGRLGIYELLVLTDAIRALVVTKRPASALRQQAGHEGMRTLRDDGRIKIREGFTTIAEVLRATPEGE